MSPKKVDKKTVKIRTLKTDWKKLCEDAFGQLQEAHNNLAYVDLLLQQTCKERNEWKTRYECERTIVNNLFRRLDEKGWTSLSPMFNIIAGTIKRTESK